MTIMKRLAACGVVLVAASLGATAYGQEAAAPPPERPLAAPAPPGDQPVVVPEQPPAAPVIEAVPVRFTAGDGGSYTISVSGPVSGACRVPCTLPLAPGANTLWIAGSVDMVSALEVPAAPAVVSIRRGSPRIRAAGIALFIAGSVGGIYLTVTDRDASGMSTRGSDRRLGLAVVDLALVVVGSVMALGADRPGVEIAADASAPAAERRRGSFRLAGVGAAPVPGGALLGAALVF
jgi:hypothetical protein